MRYLFPPRLNTVRSPTNEAEANIAFRSPGLLQVADSIASTQRHNASAERGSRSMNSRIRFSVTILTAQVPILGTLESMSHHLKAVALGNGLQALFRPKADR